MSQNRVAIYCRLSRDDGNVDESQSIQSQKAILTEYAIKNNFVIHDIYIDDGYSGTDFNRPSFLRMLEDIEHNKINIVITKDLSRLGRNYIQTGYYTEDYFPKHNVRYIAINDSFDTEKEETTDFAPFKNIINEWYAKDISKKIRFTLDNKAKNGEARNTVFPIFGYTYNESYERVICPETGPIVQLIFKKYLEYGSSSKVAKYLKENKIKLPCYYNAIKYNYNKEYVLSRSEDELTNWRPHGVRCILENIEYTGTYITSKSKSKNFKLKKRDYKNKDKYVFENRYEGLIDEDTFQKVNNMISNSRSGIIPIEINLFKGLLLCNKCKRPLRFEQIKSKKKDTDLSRYFCYHKDCPECNTIKIRYLKDIIKNELLTLKNTILNHTKEFLQLAEEHDNKKQIIPNSNYLSQIQEYKKRNAELDNYIQRLFEQNAAGKVPESTYDMMMKKYSKEKEMIEHQLNLLNLNQQKSIVQKNNTPNAYKLIQLLEQLNEDEILNHQVIRSFIQSITVKTTHQHNSTKYDYQLTIRYLVLDEIIKEFLNNEQSCNIC